jgi:hypothetical protein
MPNTSLSGAACPFSSDAAYLEAEMSWLRVRTARLVAERKVAETIYDEEDGDAAHLHRPGRVGSREARCRVVELRDRETKLREQIDARLQVHRSSGGGLLGLDQVCGEHGLSAEERLVLLVALPLGISQRIAEMTLAEVLQYWGSISVGDCIIVLDPKEGLQDWIRLRGLFRPQAPLRRHGLIEVLPSRPPIGPDTLMAADLRLSLKVFGIITGDPDAVTEVEECGS